jgi:hypothetical protein
MKITHILALFAATAAYALPQGLPVLGSLTDGLTGKQDDASPSGAAPSSSATPTLDPSVKTTKDGLSE